MSSLRIKFFYLYKTCKKMLEVNGLLMTGEHKADWEKLPT